MADPLHSLQKAFEQAIGTAFGESFAHTDPSLRRSDRADFQANVAMSLAKRLGRPPREIADTIVRHLALGAICESIEVAGPGFINLRLRDDYVSREVADTARHPSVGISPAGAPETVIIDYSGPNLAKEMHVGHLRSTIIGDAIARVLEKVGHRVIRQNHVGDWGTPFGMLIEHLLDTAAHDSPDASISELNTFYREARAKFDGDQEFAERSRRRVVLLQSGDPPTLRLWRRLVEQSTRHFSAIYRRLGVTLTEEDAAGESFYNPFLAEVVEELRSRGLARPSEGALCVFPEGFTGREGDPLPLIVQKQDGGYGYATTDLTAIRYRLRDLKATRLVYVVGAPQSQHLQMVFAVAKLAGWLVPPARAEHVAFGSVLGSDKKMFKTRSGESIKLSDLLDEAVERAAQVVADKSSDLEPELKREVARAVGIGAVKYADLSSDRIKDYVFDYDRMLSFEGNTAPYLMYAHARIRSIFRRAAVEPTPLPSIVLAHPAERRLSLDLLRFGGVVSEVAATLEPHRLCVYLYELAAGFTSFYESCPVLRATTDGERQTRLALCDLTARVLETGLALLGIEAPQRM